MCKRKGVVGIGFLLFCLDQDGCVKMYVVQELRSKPEIFKEAGSYSFPLETQEEGEDNEETLWRLVAEETGIPAEMIKFLGMEEHEFHPIPGRGDITIFYGHGVFYGSPDEFDFRPPHDQDVQFAGWFTLEELLAKKELRVEVFPILGHFCSSNQLHLVKGALVSLCSRHRDLN